MAETAGDLTTVIDSRRFLFATAGVLALLASPGWAQPGRIEVHVEPHVELDAVRAGDPVRAALAVELQEGFHVNSNEPLEDYLIPTELAFLPMDGVEVRGLAYPEAIHLVTGGSETPLAVFEEQFTIGIDLAVSEDLAPGSHVLLGQLNYQACDDKVCYRPDKRTVQIAFDAPPRPKRERRALSAKRAKRASSTTPTLDTIASKDTAPATKKPASTSTEATPMAMAMPMAMATPMATTTPMVATVTPTVAGPTEDPTLSSARDKLSALCDAQQAREDAHQETVDELHDEAPGLDDGRKAQMILMTTMAALGGLAVAGAFTFMFGGGILAALAATASMLLGGVVGVMAVLAVVLTAVLVPVLLRLMADLREGLGADDALDAVESASESGSAADVGEAERAVASGETRATHHAKTAKHTAITARKERNRARATADSVQMALGVLADIPGVGDGVDSALDHAREVEATADGVASAFEQQEEEADEALLVFADTSALLDGWDRDLGDD